MEWEGDGEASDDNDNGYDNAEDEEDCDDECMDELNMKMLQRRTISIATGW